MGTKIPRQIILKECDMSIAQSDNERSIHAKLVYPGTDVWINKKGITDPKALSVAEAELCVAQDRTRPILNNFTLPELCSIHKHLFGRLYDWAGETRSFTTSRRGDLFCRPDFIKSYFESDITRKLKRENFLVGTTREDFSKRAAHFVSEVNAVHPFNDGNGRLTRIFLNDLAQKAGHELDIQRIASRKDVWYDAMKNAFNGDMRALENEILAAMPEKAIEVNQTPEESLKKAKEAAYEQAEKIRGKGIVKIADPETAKPQHGKITSIEQHHVVMQTGANVLTIHARPPGQDVQVGKSIKIAYTNGKAQVVPARGQEPQRGKGMQR